MIIVVFHFETRVYTVPIVFPLSLKKSPSSNSNASLNVLRLGSSSKPNIVSLVRSSQGYQERSSPIFVDSIFSSFAFLRSSRIDADRFVACFYEIERNARAHLSPRGITVASDTDVAERGFSRRSIHDERKDAIVRRANVSLTVVRVCSVHRAPCTRESRAGMLRARRKKRIFHASGTPIYARPFLDALKRLKLSIE